MNPYNVGAGGFIVTSLYVIILAFMWRALAIKLVSSPNPKLSTLGASMGATL